MTDVPPRGAVPLLRELQSERVATMKAQMRVNNATGAFVRSRMGWRLDLPEKEGAAIATAAGEIIKAIEKGETPDHPIASVVSGFVIVNAKAREPLDEHRERIEKRMRESAESLPVYKWVDTVHGFGELGLAIIVGEAGDLSSYANPGKLWKRFGLATGYEGKAQRKSTNPELAAQMGYSPRRRSAMWTIGDSLLKKQNPYRDLYLHQKEKYRLERPQLTKMHTHRMAQRYAEKRLLRDLWRAWRDA